MVLSSYERSEWRIETITLPSHLEFESNSLVSIQSRKPLAYSTNGIHLKHIEPSRWDGSTVIIVEALEGKNDLLV
jgi:hypothetical protein